MSLDLDNQDFIITAHYNPRIITFDTAVPVLYSFLPNKTKSIYILLFNELRTITLSTI